MKDKEYVYERNIRVIEKFYSSDFCTELDDLKENILKRPIINTIYLDPDMYDEQLYVDLARKFIDSEKPEKYVGKTYGVYTLSYKIKDREFKMSSDAMCGWKKLYKLREGDKSWLIDYCEIRANTSGYFVWPKHAVPTINTLRYAVFKDRVDHTLFDISIFYGYKEIFDVDKNITKFKNNVEKCKLGAAYLNEKGTNSWLLAFDSFIDFIDKMCLKRFVNKDYKVINLETLIEMSNEDIYYEFTENYLVNLKKILASNEDNYFEKIGI